MKEQTNKMIFVCLFVLGVILSVTDGSSIDNNPGTVSIQENYDDTHNMWTISATCYVRYTYSYTCNYVAYTNCGWLGWSSCSKIVYYICYAHAYTDVQCNVCKISDSSGHFQISDKTVQKKECGDKYCGTCTAGGCLTGGITHSIGVKCARTGYETDGAISGSFNVYVYTANPPTFYYSASSSISVSHDTAGAGTWINRLVPSTSDNGSDYDYARYRQNSGPGLSYLHRTADLFYLQTSNGNVYVGKDLTLEFSYWFTMNLCVYDRRGREVCHDLSITLWACFQTPNCTDQVDLSLHDTYGTYTNGHGGDSNTLFNMIYPEPSEHFPSFSSVWHDLTWTFDLNEFPEATINSDTGEIYITRNISIWPAWPTKDYRQIVRVSNSQSCYTTTCSFHIRVHYTNWPIQIRSLPTSYYLHEDYDWRILIHSLVVYDYNYASEDNMTCDMIDWSPHEDNMFEFIHDGNYAYNSYKLYKLACQTPDCGYKHNVAGPQDWYCYTDIGCLTHNRTQQYTVTIKCDDAYNTTDTEVFTFNVIKNAVPVYRELPTHRDLDSSTVTYLDNIFEILYWDTENEDLIYEYDIGDVDTGIDPGYFLTSPWGNYYNQLGNITMTVHLWDKEVNKTYRIHICGHERRNEICEDLTLDVEEYCSASPDCNSDSVATDTEFAIGDELFDISTLVTPGTFNSLSYSIRTVHASLFTVDTSTGKVTTLDEFEEIFDSATYSIVAYVYDDGACNYGQCQLTVTVSAINYAVQITNLPATVYISEDTTSVETVFHVETSDDNANDTFECEIINTNSVEPFYLDRVPPVSGDYLIKNRENGVLSSATTTYSLTIECTDSHGGSDADALTIEVTLNEAPAFTGFGTSTTSITADPMNYVEGDTIYTVSATDNEGDDLTFTCSVAKSNVPFECQAGATFVHVILIRSLRIDDDNGETYIIEICLKDAKHSDQCGDLEVTFTRVKTRPEITNLPDTISFAEDLTVGETLFEAALSDLVVGESYYYTIKVEPVTEETVFQLDTSNGILTLGESFDYERIHSYLITFSVRDDYLDGLTEKTLKIDVTNVNEENTVSAEITTLTFPEDTTAYSELTDPVLTCTDIDDDTTTFAIQSGLYNDYFSIDSNSGRISLVKVWDLEGQGLPQLTSLIISCTDPGGLSSTVGITLNIEDVNDIYPELTVDPGAVFPISVGSSTCLCTNLLSFSANDLDYSDDDDFEFEILGEGVGSEFFRIVKTSGNTAYLSLKKKINFNNDKTFSIIIKVSDGEPSPLFVGETVPINFTTGDPDAKTKDISKCISCTSNGKTIIIALGVEGAVCLLFGAHIVYSCFFSGGNNVKGKGINLDKSRNQRFKRQQLAKIGLSSGGAAGVVTTTKAIEMKQTRSQNKNKRKEESSSNSDSSSSSSSDSEDNDRIRPLRTGPVVVNSRFTPHNMVKSQNSTGLPSPLYSSRTNSVGIGPPVSPGGINPGFIV